jgi:hypothetical protein
MPSRLPLWFWVLLWSHQTPERHFLALLHRHLWRDGFIGLQGKLSVEHMSQLCISPIAWTQKFIDPGLVGSTFFKSGSELVMTRLKSASVSCGGVDLSSSRCRLQLHETIYCHYWHKSQVFLILFLLGDWCSFRNKLSPLLHLLS